MSAPLPPPVPAAPDPSRGAQVVLGVFLALLVGLLAYRGYGDRFTARPTEAVPTPALLDLNTADQAELAQVPGVGPKLAEAIIDHRRTFGPFKSVGDLMSVRGVGPITFEKIHAQFRVRTSPGAAAEVSSPSYSVPVNPPRPAPTGSKKIQPGEPPINVNTASAAELQRLPDIGVVRAQAIIAARGSAPFRSVDDLDKVKGIGPKTLEKLRPFVVVR